MKNYPQQQEEKRSGFFFAYGSPQFVLGATLLNMFLNSNAKTKNSFLNFFFILGLSSVIAIVCLFAIVKTNQIVSTPNHSVDGHYGSWDWRNNGDRYEINNEKMNFTIFHSEIDSLPQQNKMKEIIDNSIKTIENKTKGFELKKITMGYEWISAYPSLRRCLVMKIDYHSSEGKDDWVWNGSKYIAVKTDGDLSQRFEFDTYKLK